MHKDQYNLQQTLLSPLNNSSSKFQFSFPKANRFNTKIPKIQSEYKYYNIPSMKSKIAPSFGISKKTDFAVYSSVPDPTRYKIKSQFQTTNKGIKFGISRQNAKSQSFLQISKNPGPGAYSQNPEFVQTKISYNYSIGKQTINKNKSLYIPGPGSYQIKSLMNQSNKVLSNDKKIGCPIIKLGNNKSLRTEPALPLVQYYPKTNVKGQKIGFLSHKGYSIGKASRFSKKSKVPIPSPGCYQVFSEFIKIKPSKN